MQTGNNFDFFQYDLEGDSTAIRDLRRRITTKTCYEEAIKDVSF